MSACLVTVSTIAGQRHTKYHVDALDDSMPANNLVEVNGEVRGRRNDDALTFRVTSLGQRSKVKGQKVGQRHKGQGSRFKGTRFKASSRAWFKWQGFKGKVQQRGLHSDRALIAVVPFPHFCSWVTSARNLTPKWIRRFRDLRTCGWIGLPRFPPSGGYSFGPVLGILASVLVMDGVQARHPNLD
jgi:hypothetical protein